MVAKKYCDEKAERFGALEQAKISSLDQIRSLRIIFKSLAASIEKINTDVDDSLSQKDKDAIRGIVKDLYEVMEEGEGTVSKILPRRNFTPSRGWMYFGKSRLLLSLQSNACRRALIR